MSRETWVFIHGWGSTSEIWADLLEHFKEPYQLLGVPAVDPTAASPEQAIENALEQLAQQLPASCILVGWSLGGMLATELARRCADQVSALVCLACNPSFVQRETWSTAMAPATFANFCESFAINPGKTLRRFRLLQAQGDAQRQEIVGALAQRSADAQWQQNSAASQLQWLALLDNRAALGELRCPQLHILGVEDQLVPVACGAWLEQINSAKVHRLPSVAHAPQLAQPRQVVDALLGWHSAFAERGAAAETAAANAVAASAAAATAEVPIAKPIIARSFSAAAERYDVYADLQQQVAERLLERFGAYTVSPAPELSALDLGCGTGFVAAGLLKAGLAVTGLDIAQGMLHRARHKLPELTVCAGDAEALPFAERCFDYCISSLSLQWCSALPLALAESHRVLDGAGILAFSTLCEGTLHELKSAWAQVDDYVHVNAFLPAEQVIEQVQAAGFELVLVESATITQEFAQLMDLLRALKAIGAHNMNAGRARALTSPASLRALERNYAPFISAAGQFCATYQVLNIIARKAP